MSHALSTKSLIVVTVIVLAVSPMVLSKKPTPPPEPPAAPIEYQLTFIDPVVEGVGSLDTIKDVNSHGVGVGYGRKPDGTLFAIRWTKTGGVVAQDSLSSNWFDLNTDTYVDNWETSTSWSINDANQIVGTARNIVDYELMARPYVFEDGVFYLLPTLWEDWMVARFINENGHVLGDYRFDGSFQFPYIWNPHDPGSVHLTGVDFETLAISNNYCLGHTNGVESTVYSFHFDANGELVYEVSESFPDEGLFFGLEYHGINNNDYYTFHGRYGRNERVELRHAPTRTSITIAERRMKGGRAGYRLGALNNAQDVVYVEGKRDMDEMYIYRYSEERSLNILSLMDSTSREAFLAVWESTPHAAFVHFSLVDDEIAGVPAADPYDTIVGEIHNGPVFVLTPVELP